MARGWSGAGRKPGRLVKSYDENSIGGKNGGARGKVSSGSVLAKERVAEEAKRKKVMQGMYSVEGTYFLMISHLELTY